MLGTFSEDEVKKICADLDKSKAVVFCFFVFFRLMLDMEGNGCNMLVTKHVLLQKTLGPSLQDGEVSYAEFAAW